MGCQPAMEAMRRWAACFPHESHQHWQLGPTVPLEGLWPSTGRQPQLEVDADAHMLLLRPSAMPGCGHKQARQQCALLASVPGSASDIQNAGTESHAGRQHRAKHFESATFSLSENTWRTLLYLTLFTDGMLVTSHVPTVLWLLTSVHKTFVELRIRRNVRFGRRAAVGIGCPVTGDSRGSPCFALIQPMIAWRSYVKPSAATTGSVIFSCT